MVERIGANAATRYKPSAAHDTRRLLSAHLSKSCSWELGHYQTRSNPGGFQKSNQASRLWPTSGHRTIQKGKGHRKTMKQQSIP
jgi:hypothetical protein